MEKKEINAGISLYELNKQVMAQLPPQDMEHLKKQLTSVATWFSTFKPEIRWFILLCREKADYTVFHINSSDFYQALKELKLTINYRGELMAVNFIHGENAFEIWIRDINTQEVSMYMLFNCAPMIIEI